MSNEQYNYLMLLVYLAPESEVDANGKPVDVKARTIQFDSEDQFNHVKKQMKAGNQWIVFTYGSQELPITVNLKHPNLCWAKLLIERVKEGSTIVLPNGRLPAELVK